MLAETTRVEPSIPHPERSFILPDRFPFSVHLFGRQTTDGREQDWLKVGGGRKRLGVFLQNECPEVTRVFAPNASQANGVCVGAAPEFFGNTEEIALGLILYDEAFADGVLYLEQNTAFWCPSGGCPVVVLSDGSDVHVTHAGSRSLGVRGDRFGRHVNSVLDLMMDCFDRPEEVWAYIFCGKGPWSFPHDMEHPQWGESNARLIPYVREHFGEACAPTDDNGVPHIAMHEVIGAQLKRRHVDPEHISWDGFDTVTDKSHGEYRWHDQSRSPKRNGVLVVRH